MLQVFLCGLNGPLQSFTKDKTWEQIVEKVWHWKFIETVKNQMT